MKAAAALCAVMLALGAAQAVSADPAWFTSEPSSHSQAKTSSYYADALETELACLSQTNFRSCRCATLDATNIYSSRSSISVGCQALATRMQQMSYPSPLSKVSGLGYISLTQGHQSMFVLAERWAPMELMVVMLDVKVQTSSCSKCSSRNGLVVVVARGWPTADVMNIDIVLLSSHEMCACQSTPTSC
jgi:hypothetical protein